MSKAANTFDRRRSHDLASCFVGNRLLSTFSPGDRAMMEQCGELVQLSRGDTLVEVGGEVSATYFPCPGAMLALALRLEDGRTVEVATIGSEGALCGIVSCGRIPAFACASVQIAGSAVRIDIDDLEALKVRSPAVRSLFCRYADALLSQVMQSVACNAHHALDARFCRWLLTVHDRIGRNDLPLTQEDFAQMLGVQRTTVTSIVRNLQNQGYIRQSRGSLRILDRAAIEQKSCECYLDVKTHFHAVLPEIKPQKISDARTPA